MGGLITASTVLTCPHGGTVQIVFSHTKVRAGGGFVARASDTFLVAGCPFMLGVVYHPCMTVKWEQPALRSKAVADFTLTSDSVGVCKAADQAVQGTVLVNGVQPQVKGR
jgi:hypothetical protein